MGTPAAFTDILNGILSGFGESRGMPETPPFEPRYIPPHPLLFAEPHRPFRPSPYWDIPRQERTYRRAAPATPNPKPPRPAFTAVRPKRVLTARQRRALEGLIELGADLTPDFTAAELRSAYRRLALKYHPDRHSASSEGEKARLTRVLADLNQHHRELAAAVRSAA